MSWKWKNASAKNKRKEIVNIISKHRERNREKDTAKAINEEKKN